MPESEMPRLLSAEPLVLVSDVLAACSFYVDKLGFEVAFSYGEPPFFAQVKRDGARLNLRLVRQPIYAPDLRARESDLLCAMITAANVGALYRDVEKAGASLHQPLRREPWGSHTFIVADPDGNLIGFAGQ